MKYIKTWLCLSFLGVLIFLNLGAIRKNEDPIARTQTDPISYKQKREENKDGVKGAPKPSFKYYEKEEFLVNSPMGMGKEGEPPPMPAGIAEVSEVEWHDEIQAEGEGLEEDEVTEEIPEAEGIEDEDDWEDMDEDWWMGEDLEKEENPEESVKATDVQG